MAREIPIQNLYYLLAFAWDHLPEADEVEIAADDCHSLTELFARILAHGTLRLVKRGLDRDYLHHREETAIPRGRMNLVGSFPLLAAKRGRLVCEFEDLSHNTLPNRILKTTIGELLHDRLRKTAKFTFATSSAIPKECRCFSRPSSATFTNGNKTNFK